MSLTTFSWPVTIAGALVLAGIVFLLQRLKARRRIVHLPALALWNQAARAAPVRVLGGRFRYWLAYLLVLAICLLLWFAAAHPVVDPAARGGRQIFYLDASAALASGDEAATARAALLADVRAMPAAGREVFLGDGTGSRLLAAGESASLLAQRLDGVAPAPRPSGFGPWLAATVTRLRGAAATVHYYGGWPAARAAAVGLPASIRLRYGYLTKPVAGNRGIVALGVTPAASGAWSKADVLVALAPETAGPQDLSWTLDGAAFAPARAEPVGAGTFVVRDVAAAGGTLVARLRRGDAFPADDLAGVHLPDRRPVRVALAAGIPAIVRAAIAADDGLALADAADAQVVVRRAGDTLRPDLPALTLTDPARQGETFVFAGPGEAARGALLARLDEFGLGGIDAGAMADALRQPIAVDVRDAPRRLVSVWGALFDPRDGFAKSAAMPLFVARGLRWLAGSDGWVPYAKAGSPAIDQSRLYGLNTATAADLGAADVPPAASLTDRATTAMAADRSVPPAAPDLPGRGPPDRSFVIVLLMAGLLLSVEWWLFQRGRMP